VTLSSELLAALREAGLTIEPHSHDSGEWFASTVAEDLGDRNFGPFEGDEAALVAGVTWLIGLTIRARTERDAMWLDLRQTKKALEAAQAELRAEREIRGL
jgi:hypothetical protein